MNKKQALKNLKEAIAVSKDYRIKTRMMICLLREKGLSYSQIAEEVGGTPWLSRYWVKHGNIKDLSSFEDKKRGRKKGWKKK